MVSPFGCNKYFTNVRKKKIINNINFLENILNVKVAHKYTDRRETFWVLWNNITVSRSLDGVLSFSRKCRRNRQQ